MSIKTKAIVANALIYIGVLAVITVSWQIAETMLYGEVHPNQIDSVVAVLLGMTTVKTLGLQIIIN